MAGVRRALFMRDHRFFFLICLLTALSFLQGDAKFGFAGERNPRSVMPNCTAVPYRSQRKLVGDGTNDANSATPVHACTHLRARVSIL